MDCEDKLQDKEMSRLDTFNNVGGTFELCKVDFSVTNTAVKSFLVYSYEGNAHYNYFDKDAIYDTQNKT